MGVGVGVWVWGGWCSHPDGCEGVPHCGFNFAFPWWWVILSIFSCAYLSFGYLLWRNVFSSPFFGGAFHVCSGSHQGEDLSLSTEELPVSSATPGLGPGGPEGSWACSIISEGHWVLVGYGPVDHDRVLGVGAECGQNYRQATTGEGCPQHQFLGTDILEEDCDSLGHPDLSGSEGGQSTPQAHS